MLREEKTAILEVIISKIQEDDSLAIFQVIAMHIKIAMVNAENLVRGYNKTVVMANLFPEGMDIIDEKIKLSKQ